MLLYLEDVRIAVRERLLRPLGEPVPQNAIKYFARVEIEQAMVDQAFLHKLTKTILRHHKQKEQEARPRDLARETQRSLSQGLV